MTELGVSAPSQSELGSNGKEGVLHFPQVSKARTSPSDSLVTYPWHTLEGYYPTAEIQSVYLKAPVHRAEWTFGDLNYI